MKNKSFVVKELEAAIETYKNKNKLYGESYKKSGQIKEILFPDGILLKTEKDFNRFAMMGAVLNKMIRYAAQFEKGGHTDSARDAIVYAAILREIDEGS